MILEWRSSLNEFIQSPYISLYLFITPPWGQGLVITFFFPWCFFLLVVTCPRPPVFAWPKKYSSCLSLHSQGLLSWVTVTYFTPPAGGGGEQRRGLMPLGLFFVNTWYQDVTLFPHKLFRNEFILVFNPNEILVLVWHRGTQEENLAKCLKYHFLLS